MTKKGFTRGTAAYTGGGTLPSRACPTAPTCSSRRWVAESTERAMPDAGFGSETGPCRSRLTAGIVV